MTCNKPMRGITVTVLAPTFGELVLLVPFQQLETPGIDLDAAWCGIKGSVVCWGEQMLPSPVQIRSSWDRESRASATSGQPSIQ